MSDLMLFGVLRMPMPDNPAEMGVLEWAQVKDRMRQAADEIEKARAELAAARQDHQRDVDQMRQAWADDTQRLRAELAAERERGTELWKASVAHIKTNGELRDALREARKYMQSPALRARIDALAKEGGDA